MPSDATPDEVIEEDASELRFPKEFAQGTCDALLTSEVFLLLDHRRQPSVQKVEIEDFSEVFVKTLNYARRLSRFKNRDTIKAVRSVFAPYQVPRDVHSHRMRDGLHMFEVAQLSNLCPESAKEASEFAQGTCVALLTSEVFLLLDHRRQQSEQKEEIEDLSEVFVKTLNYARRLSRFKNSEEFHGVRSGKVDDPVIAAISFEGLRDGELMKRLQEEEKKKKEKEKKKEMEKPAEKDNKSKKRGRSPSPPGSSSAIPKRPVK